MTAIEKLATAIKDRKGLEAGGLPLDGTVAVGDDDEASPVTTSPLTGRPCRRARSPSQHERLRLEAQARKATKLAVQAEREAIALEAELAAALQRIDELEHSRAASNAVAEQYRSRSEKEDSASACVRVELARSRAEIARLNAELRRSTSRIETLTNRMEKCRAASWRRVTVLEEEIERLRAGDDEEQAWQALRRDLQTLLREHPVPGVVSLRALAAAIGVDSAAALRWIRGSRPRRETQIRIAAWVKEHSPGERQPTK